MSNRMPLVRGSRRSPLHASRSAQMRRKPKRTKCPTMRKINIGVSVAPPNVVHTSPYVAKALGFFAKRCIDANIVQFEGGQSQTSNVAAAQGSAIVSVSDVCDRPRHEGAADLGPRAAHAAGLHGAGGHQDRRAISRASGCPRPAAASAASTGAWAARCCAPPASTSSDAQFIPSPTAGRLPGLIAGQIDGVALHPEDVFLAKQQKPTLNLLVQLVELMPLYMFNAYGASIDWIARDRPLLRDTVAAMIEANRAIYRDKDKVVPIIVEATKKPKDAVEYAIGRADQELRLVGQRRLRRQSARNGRSTTASRTATSPEDKKPTVEQVANMKLAEEAVERGRRPRDDRQVHDVRSTTIASGEFRITS